jgi:hypothetical protein
MSDQVVKVIGDVLLAMSPLLIAAVSWLAVKLGNLIKSKTDNALLSSGLLRLNHAVFLIVKELMQTVAEDLKKANADGKLTDTEKKQIKDAALAKLKSYIGFGEIARLFSLESEAKAAEFAGSLIENAVRDVKVEASYANPTS